MSLPQSFSYFVNKLAGVKKNRVRLVPNNSSTVNSGTGQLIFDLPSDSIVDLDTMSLRGNFIYTNAAANNGIRLVPQSNLLFRSIVWQLNGQSVAGIGSQHQNLLSEVLRRCTSDVNYETAHANEYLQTPTLRFNPIAEHDKQPSGSEIASNSTSQRFHFNQFYGLSRSPNSRSWDTSLWGSTRIVMQVENGAICVGQGDAGGTTASYDFQLQNCEMTIDVINFSDPTYDNMMQSILSQGTVSTVFPEYYTQIANYNSNLKFQVSTQSLDYVGFAGLLSSYNNPTVCSADTTNHLVQDADLPYGPNFCRFRLLDSSGAVIGVNDTTTQYYFNINQEVYPKQGPQAITDGADQTIDLFCGRSVNRGNLLWRGLDNSYGYYIFTREQFTKQNAIVCVDLTLDGPAHTNAQRLCSGLDTRGQSSQINLQLINGYAGSSASMSDCGYAFTTATIPAQGTALGSQSQLIFMFAASSSILEVAMGQQISVVY